MRYSACFGTVATGRAWFRVRYRDELPAWTAPAVNAKTFVIPGSNPPRSETEIVSIGPSTLTWRLWFATLEDYWALLAKLTQTDVLTVPANIQSHRGTYREDQGRGVVDLIETTLLSLDADAPLPDGQLEATAVWQRHIDPATGLVVPS